ncbi:MAG: hypothetical protein L6R41_002027 [Letrouitia leprolyta]|nr:MAG: hypothetical protein L6R41_002027 [Letrouitia leprolyta]
MPSDTPNPQHWTLRFKHHKTTVLLFVAPHQSFTSVKEDLLHAIKATRVTEINGNPLPSNLEDVIFGVPIDGNDPSQGWINLEIPELEEDGGKKGNKNPSVLNATPIGAGLKDGMALAFKFRKQTSGGDEMDIDDNEWDVVIPNYDDEEGSQVKNGEGGDSLAEDDI